MRVLFASYAERTATVFQTMVPLAWALRTAGHEVRVAAQPELVERIVGAGLTAVPVGRDHDLWRIQERFMARLAAGRPEEYAHRVRGGRMPPFDSVETADDELDVDDLVAGYRWAVSSWYRMVNQPMLDDLVGYCRSWRPDLVVWEPGTYAAPIAAAACDAAHVRLLWSQDLFGYTRERFRALAGPSTPDPLAEWLADRADRFGVGFDEDMTTGQATVDQLPPSLRLPATRPVLGLRYVPYNGAAEVASWLWRAPERPRVALTLGLTMADRFGGFAMGLGEVLDALAGDDVEVVATLPDTERDKLGTIPPNARVVPFVPLHALVPTCSAVIHHAGFGTLLTTARRGVPQVCLPEHFDEPPLAERLAATGAGLAIPATGADGATVAGAVRALLSDPAHAAGADRLRTEIDAMPSPAELAGDLERFAADRRPLLARR